MSKIDVKYSNSAGRLLAVLDSLTDRVPLAQQLIPVMLGEAKSADNKVIASKGVKVLGELHRMYSDFLEDLEQSDIPEEEKSLYSNGLSSLENIMYPMAINGAARKISESEKSLLSVLATRLDKEPEVSEEDLNLIRESIAALRETINDTATSPVLRKVLLELVRLTEDALNRYQIYGSKGLKKAFKGMLAEVSEVYLQDGEDKEDIKKSTAWAEIVKHLKLIDTVAAKTMGYIAMLQQASQYLLS